MRKSGWIRERDKDGWRIPMEGSLSRKIYDRVVQGESPKDIAKALRIDIGKVRVLKHRFSNPDWAKERRA